MSEWTEDLKNKVKKRYLDDNPTATAENSIEKVKLIAEEIKMTSNGTRMILTKQGVYIKAAKAAAAAKAGDDGDKPKRVHKQDSIDALTKLLEDNEVEVDLDIVSKMTGKAAVYFSTAIEKIISSGD